MVHVKVLYWWGMAELFLFCAPFALFGCWDFLFAFFFAFRYLRLVVGILAFILYNAKPVLKNPRYTCMDASVIIPTTFSKPDELAHCITRILLCTPAQIFVVTADANVQAVQELCASLNIANNISVLGVAILNKRAQILRALDQITTSITILADDDVFWPDGYLPILLAIFEDGKVGAGGTRQRVQRKANPDRWNMYGIAYLERRVFNNCATNAIDGGISTLSGRTAAYRTAILKNDDFKSYFTNDEWRGKPLNSDDDKCLTRYVYTRGWKIVLQFDPRAIIETTVESGEKYEQQCLRWARAHWRGNFTVMENESYWRSWSMLWTWYYVYLGQFQTPALLVEGFLFFLLFLALMDSSSSTAHTAYALLAGWILFTKIVKLIPHFLRHPSDMRFIPFLVCFSYTHGWTNFYAWYSMEETGWGSQDLKELAKARTDQEIETREDTPGAMMLEKEGLDPDHPFFNVSSKQEESTDEDSVKKTGDYDRSG